MQIEIRKCLPGLLMLWACLVLGAAVQACTGRFLAAPASPVIFQNENFIVVTAAKGDSLPSLAEKFLQDADKAWWIACANEDRPLTLGQPVVIPFSAAACSSLELDGYQQIPVLRYAAITSDSKDTQAVHAAAFEQQMMYLKTNGLRTISLDRLHAFLNFEAKVAPDSVVITFDSSNRWVYEFAFPVLKELSMQAAVFITTDRIGQPGHLTWEELTQMADAGFEIGTSGLTGRDLTTMQPNENAKAYLKAISSEISDSQTLLANLINRPVHYFAYPHGQAGDLIGVLLKNHGYRLAFTRLPGGNPVFENNYKLNRFTVDGSDDMSLFEQKLTTFHSANLK